MANVNLKSLTTVLGENSSIADIPTTASGIVTCQNNQVLKINSLYVANIDGTNSANITADLHNGTSVLSYLVKNTVIGAGGSINIITAGSPVYITEGQTVRLTSSSSGDLSGFVSYERIS
ncbi:MAG: hypothetical protein EBU90_14355 [Proteobacteria bacterium]|nr:hypothetical protein [Pseudomonadota bacterium]NBP16017.1 hypothetical protein [bacterium]